MTNWRNDYDYVEFDYTNYAYFELNEEIHSHQLYKQSKGWLVHFYRDKNGVKWVEFMMPDEPFPHQSMPYRLDWMQNAQFVRSKPLDGTADVTESTVACP